MHIADEYVTSHFDIPTASLYGWLPLSNAYGITDKKVIFERRDQDYFIVLLGRTMQSEKFLEN